MSTTFVLVWKDCFHHISIKKIKTAIFNFRQMFDKEGFSVLVLQ